MAGELHLAQCVDFIILRSISLLRDVTHADETMRSNNDIRSNLNELENLSWRAFSPSFEPCLILNKPFQTIEFLNVISDQVLILFEKLESGTIIAQGLLDRGVTSENLTEIPKSVFQKKWCLYRNQSQLTELTGDNSHLSFHYKNIVLPEYQEHLTSILLGVMRPNRNKSGPVKGSIRNSTDRALLEQVRLLRAADPFITMPSCIAEMTKNPALKPLMSGVTTQSLDKRLRRNYEKVFGEPWA